MVDLIVGLIEEQLQPGISPEIRQKFQKVRWDFRVCYQESHRVGQWGYGPTALEVPDLHAAPVVACLL